MLDAAPGGAPGGASASRPDGAGAGAAGSVAPLIRVRGLSKSFRGVRALNGLDLELRPAESVGVIGPNGAGKSTLVGLLSGALRPTSGTIEAFGRVIDGQPPHAIARLGIARTHQVPQPFLRMTVIENLLVARRAGELRPGRRERVRRAEAILEETGLAEVRDAVAGSLTLLKLKRLELARALALDPKVLLLDEIGAGLIDSELEELIELISALRRRVSGLLVIEHLMDLIVRSCDRLVVLNWGSKLAEGSPAEVLRDDEVMRVYLGATADRRPASADRQPTTAGAVASDEAGPLRAADSSVTLTSGPAGTSFSQSLPAEAPPGGLLQVEELTAGYEGGVVVHGVSFTLRQGEVRALLGANGAGKSTIAKACTGMLRLRGGRIWLAGERIDGLAPHEIARRGLAHCLEGRRIFADLSVEENLTLGGTAIGRSRKEVGDGLGRVYELFPVLREKASQSGGALSGGQQGMLAIGRALMADPKVIVFDEISLGLAPVVIGEIYEVLARLRSQGLTMLVVEQDVDRALAIADQVLLLERGRIVLAASPREVSSHPRFRSLYLGVQ